MDKLLRVILLLPMMALADGRDLKAWCDDSDQMGKEPDMHQAASDTFLGGVCLGMIDGTFRALNRREFCAPAKVTRNDVVKVARAYLDAHPDKLTGDESQILVDAFKQAYPCFEP